MNRRSFLKFLGASAAVAVIAPTMIVSAEKFAPQATYSSQALTLADIREAKRQLVSANVSPFRGGFAGYVHPYVIADLKAGGL